MRGAVFLLVVWLLLSCGRTSDRDLEKLLSYIEHPREVRKGNPEDGLVVSAAQSIASNCNASPKLPGDYVLFEHILRGERFVVLSSHSDGGHYVFRCNHAEPGILLQAPHVFHDRGTGEIAVGIFLEGGPAFRALFMNSSHRDQMRRGRKVDLVRRRSHVFHRVTAALYSPSLSLVQVHGFSERKHENAGDLILSNGTELVTDKVMELKVALRGAQGTVHAFPVDGLSLGGTKNVQGEFWNRGETRDFLHLELSGRYRKKLLKDKSERRLLMNALKGLL